MQFLNDDVRVCVCVCARARARVCVMILLLVSLLYAPWAVKFLTGRALLKFPLLLLLNMGFPDRGVNMGFPDQRVNGSL